MGFIDGLWTYAMVGEPTTRHQIVRGVIMYEAREAKGVQVPCSVCRKIIVPDHYRHCDLVGGAQYADGKDMSIAVCSDACSKSAFIALYGEHEWLMLQQRIKVK